MIARGALFHKPVISVRARRRDGPEGSDGGEDRLPSVFETARVANP